MSNVANYFRCSPRQTRQFVTECLRAGLVPFVQSSPGMGKSSIMKSVAEEYELEVIDHRLSTSAPEDLSGLPRFNERGYAEFAPFADLFPIEGTPLPGHKQGWMLFLDEFNQATKSVQSASYKLILDRMTGQKKLHEKVVITAAGNLATDRAIVNVLGTAMQSRVVHIEMEINFNEWLEDVALKQNYDQRIIGFLAQFPSKLMTFDPNHTDKTFCCPRTWEFMNRLLSVTDVTDDRVALYGGTISPGIAAEFVQFTKIYSSLINIREVITNPATAPLPEGAPMKWATVSMLMEKVDAKNFNALAEYMSRFDLTFRVLFFRSVLVRNPEFRNLDAFRQNMLTLSRYLHS